MSTLFNFLENFNPSVLVHIIDENRQEVWPECQAVDVPQKITNKCSVIKENVINNGKSLEIMVHKH